MAFYKDNPPSPDILMNSMRSIGYSFESAVADIIDNSISANAKKISIGLPTTQNDVVLTILDDGTGMDNDELFNAMRYGSKSIDDVRSDSDLGRFGLGLKSASLSQCRKLTVLSKKDNKISGYCWDLDYVDKCKKWTIIGLTSQEMEKRPFYKLLEAQSSGTLVIWENFDTLDKTSSGNTYQEIVNKVCSTSKRLGLIFHRFLSSKNNPIAISVNNNPIIPLDPFLETSNNPHLTIKKTSVLELKDGNGVIRTGEVTPYILPFVKDLTAKDFALLGEDAELLNKPGFYLYRNKRLIVWGSWLGMKPNNELSRYARLKVDFPSTLDSEWAVDIKKQSASLPLLIRKQLQAKVDDAFNSSVRQNIKRRTINSDNSNSLWTRTEDRNGHFFYSFNRKSCVFDTLKSKMTEADYNLLEDFLSACECSIPYQDIYSDQANNCISNSNTDNDKFIPLAIESVKKFMSDNKNDDVNLCAKFVCSIQPFSNIPNIESIVLEALKND